MSRLNGSLQYVVAILVILIIAVGAVLRLAPEPSSTNSIVTIVGFAGMLAKSFIDSMNASIARAEQRAALADTAKAVEAAKTVIVETKATVEQATAAIAEKQAETHEKVVAAAGQIEVVRQDVNGKMAEMNRVLSEAAYARGVKAAQDQQGKDEEYADAQETQRAADRAQGAADAAVILAQAAADRAQGAAEANAISDKKAVDLEASRAVTPPTTPTEK